MTLVNEITMRIQAIAAIEYALKRQSHAEPWSALERAYQILTGGDPNRIPELEQVDD